MKHIPSYLMPKIAPPSGVNSTQDDNEDLGHIPFRKKSRNHHQNRSSKNRHFTYKKRKNDPLKTFSIGDAFLTKKRQRKK